ncbi:MAG: WYL domain-containing protein [Micrococcaceae bacterium]
MPLKNDERIMNLVIALVGNDRGITREEIHRLVDDYSNYDGESFEKLFSRDKAILRNKLNFDIKIREDAFDDPNNKRYFIRLEDYEGKDLEFSPDELQLIYSAMKSFNSRQFKDISYKLLSKVDISSQPFYQYLLDDPDIDSTLVMQILSAINAGKSLQFTYSKPGGSAEVRNVYPYGMSLASSHWYLAAYDFSRKGMRTFRLSRIESKTVKETDEMHTKDPHFNIEEYLQKTALDTGSHKGEVKIVGKVPAWVQEHLVTVTPDTCSFTYHDSDKAARFIAQAAGSVQVVKPVEIKEKVEQIFRACLNKPSVDDPEALLRKVHNYKGKGVKTPADVRLKRLLNLLPFLIENEPISVQEVADHFEVTPKQIRDDIALLTMTGRPSEYHQHQDLIDLNYDNDIITVQDPQNLEHPVKLTAEESIYLSYALSFIAVVDPHSAKTAQALIAKISAPELAEKLRTSLKATVSIWSGDSLVKEKRQILQEAIDSKTLIKARYVSSRSGKKHIRELAPQKLLFKNSQWYVIATEQETQEDKIFIVSKLENLALTQQKSGNTENKPQTDGQFAQGKEYVALLDNNETYFDVKLNFTKLIAEDSTRLVSFSTPYEQWLTSVLLAAGDTVLMVSPRELDEKAKSLAQKALASQE